jgi:Carboxypeptidase regulatory-like domain
MSSLRSEGGWFRALLTLVLVVGSLLLTGSLSAQTSVSSGSIAGAVTDPTGAVLAGAKVTITNQQTGQASVLTSNGSGSYTTGALAPGAYRVEVTAAGFSKTATTVNVQVGNTTTADMRLSVGQESQTIEVQSGAVTVNTEQAEVQGVLTSQQIENLPVNGRNFLDLAQLEPGVQIQDGQNFDPTKAG